MMDDLQLWIPRRQTLNDFFGTIRTAIIDDDQFIALGYGTQYLIGSRHQRFQVLRFIKSWETGRDPNGASCVSRGCSQACAGLLPRYPQERIRLGASLARARFVAVWPGSHTVTSDCSKNNRD